MAGSTLLIIALSLFGLAVSFYYMKKVTSIQLDKGLNKEEGDKLRYIHGAIAEGAMAFLKQEYKVLFWFMLAFAVVIALLTDNHETANGTKPVLCTVVITEDDMKALIRIRNYFGENDKTQLELQNLLLQFYKIA